MRPRTADFLGDLGTENTLRVFSVVLYGYRCIDVIVVIIINICNNFFMTSTEEDE